MAMGRWYLFVIPRLEPFTLEENKSEWRKIGKGGGETCYFLSASAGELG